MTDQKAAMADFEVKECAHGCGVRNMTDQKPIGVFVRLPLSESQVKTLEYQLDGYNSALLAIGTPVTGGELEVVCSIDEDILRDISELDDDDEEYVTDMVFKPNPEGVDTAPLVRQSDALAKLAEKDAEIARLREALHGINGTAHNPSKTVWVRIEEVQKEAENAIRNLGAAP